MKKNSNACETSIYNTNFSPLDQEQIAYLIREKYLRAKLSRWIRHADTIRY